MRQATAWELQGKLAIKLPDDKLSANIYWRYSEDRDELTLTTMLGTTVLTLNSTLNSAHWHIDGKDFATIMPSVYLERVSGWSIPWPICHCGSRPLAPMIRSSHAIAKANLNS